MAVPPDVILLVYKGTATKSATVHRPPRRLERCTTQDRRVAEADNIETTEPEPPWAPVDKQDTASETCSTRRRTLSNA